MVAVVGALALILVVAGIGLASNFVGMAERITLALNPSSDGVSARVRRWRGLGLTYVVCGGLLALVAVLMR